ncbi:class C sortase [Leucobacter massiliensis]|uniref:class C sortase n=1 Tax=Leucobacter massiliensis TaxID=1686285 RepID=UPI0011B21C9B|nr:class C sortase [Leucobacter massiliensis]
MTVLAMVAGVGVFTYPAAANWYNDRLHASQVHSYVGAVTRLPDAELEAAVQAARDYNALLPNGPLRDPYALDAEGNPIPIGEGKDAYEQTLRFEELGMMGELLIPKIGVDLPIFHDTDEKSLDAGVGHLYGSALPVGGKNTHSVLTAHSGIPGATLFTDLNKLRKKDQFQVVVAGETLTYEVDQILRVLPTDLDALRQIPGGDYVTLVTCTPIGVNSHRLLVRGHRIPTPEEALPAHQQPMRVHRVRRSWVRRRSGWRRVRCCLRSGWSG